LNQDYVEEILRKSVQGIIIIFIHLIFLNYLVLRSDAKGLVAIIHDFSGLIIANRSRSPLKVDGRAMRGNGSSDCCNSYRSPRWRLAQLENPVASPIGCAFGAGFRDKQTPVQLPGTTTKECCE
jgi:hypothetical protein